MKYLGMDVHSESSTWCLLDARGEAVREGSVETTAGTLAALVQELAGEEPMLAGQEVGTMSYLVHDTLSAAGTRVLSFNAAQLRMIAASRKKTDRRDASGSPRRWRAGCIRTPRTSRRARSASCAHC